MKGIRKLRQHFKDAVTLAVRTVSVFDDRPDR